MSPGGQTACWRSHFTSVIVCSVEFSPQDRYYHANPLWTSLQMRNSNQTTVVLQSSNFSKVHQFNWNNFACITLWPIETLFLSSLQIEIMKIVLNPTQISEILLKAGRGLKKIIFFTLSLKNKAQLHFIQL